MPGMSRAAAEIVTVEIWMDCSNCGRMEQRPFSYFTMFVEQGRSEFSAGFICTRCGALRACTCAAAVEGSAQPVRHLLYKGNF